MGLLLRVRRARLAGRVIRRLRRAGLSDARYDARGFRVRFTADGDDTPTILELAPLLATRGGRRRELVDRFVAGLVGTPRLPRAWAEAGPLLRPVLRGGTPGTPLRRSVLPFLYEYVVIDQPDAMTYVGSDQPAAWGVTAEEVFEAALANLSGAALHGVAAGPVVVRFVDDGDAYWTSHLLLPHWLNRLAGQVGGAPVAFAPERGTLLVTADGSEHLRALFAEAEEIYAKTSRPITPMAYASDEHGCPTPYVAPPGHPLHHPVQRAERLLAVHEYARQATQGLPTTTQPPPAATQPPDATQPPTGVQPPVASQPPDATRTGAGRMLGHAATPAKRKVAKQKPGRAAKLKRGRGDAPAETASDPGLVPAEQPSDPAPSAAMAELMLVGSEEEGWRTQAVWERDEPILLPTADEVQVGTDIRPWSRVRPHLRAMPGVSPPRWAADRWPPP